MRKIAQLLVIAALCAVAAFAQESKLNGLAKPVTVTRDDRSIPYIAAQNEADLYFVQGYTTASDRLWQMDLMRRVARGETSEIFGKLGLEEDKRWRRFGFAAIADEGIQYLTPDLRLALESYAKGVNAYIDTLPPEKLPVEFRILQYKPRHWTPSDTIVIGKILADALSSTWRQDLIKASLKDLDPAKLADLTEVRTEYDVINFGKDVAAKKAVALNNAPDIDPQILAAAERQDEIRRTSLERIGLYAEDLAASNNWVISGKRTADGKALLANDPHLRPTAPGIWYLSHLETPTMRVAGVTFPGVPGIVLGHNENIAWGATNVGPDVQDLYLETFNAEGKVKTPAGWETPKVRTETFNVRESPLKTETTAETMEVTVTRNGPIILEEDGKRYSLKWTAFDPMNSDFAAFFLLNRAKDWNGFKQALSTYRGASQNFVFADVKGNIGWHIAGAIPLRKTGDGSLPYDGAKNDGDWTGLIPFEELPNLYNPPSGFIVTANQRIAGTDYKYPQLIRDFAAPWRARRLYDLISKEPKATMDTVNAAQHDAFNIPLKHLADRIAKGNTASTETVALAKGWDGVMTPDSRAALVVNEIRICVANKIADASKPVPAYIVRERILDMALKTDSKRWLPNGVSNYDELIKTCDTESAAALAKRLGADRTKWTWGTSSVSSFPHPLAAAAFIGGQFATPKVPLQGSGQTPNVASYVSMRLIASPGNWDATRHVIPLGQSGDPKSPYYKDQFEPWRTGEPKILPFSKEAIGQVVKTTVIYQP